MAVLLAGLAVAGQATTGELRRCLAYIAGVSEMTRMMEVLPSTKPGATQATVQLLSNCVRWINAALLAA